MDFAESLTPCARFWSHILEASEYPHMQMQRLLEIQMIYKVTLVSKWLVPIFFSLSGVIELHDWKSTRAYVFISFFFSFTPWQVQVQPSRNSCIYDKERLTCECEHNTTGLTVAAVRGIIRPELERRILSLPSPRAQQISVSTHRHTHTYTHIPIPLTGKNNTGSVFVDNKAHMSFYSDHKPSLLLLSYLHMRSWCLPRSHYPTSSLKPGPYRNSDTKRWTTQSLLTLRRAIKHPFLNIYFCWITN